MIEAKIRSAGVDTARDHVKGEDVFCPAVEVMYYDSDTGEQVASATYKLRKGSACETMDEVTARVKEELVRLQSESDKPMPDKPKIPQDMQDKVDELMALIGEKIDLKE